MFTRERREVKIALFLFYSMPNMKEGTHYIYKQNIVVFRTQ